VAILTAMPEEASAILGALGADARRVEHGRRVYHFGEIDGTPVGVVVARCGKVAASTTVTELIVRFGASAVLCTGVAGALDPDVSIGDVVVADRLVQHDLDPRPLWPRHTVPLLETAFFEADPGWTERIVEAARAFEGAGRVHRGLIASGDQFIHDPDAGASIRAELPGVLCVEMEGAAVAQVCHEYGVPFAVFRAISDRADADAAADFTGSLGSFAATHSRGILSGVFRL
jgi:adenosylhomocysteine nucleosidase